MIYLTNRQFIKAHKNKNGVTIKEYVIPADDVIGKAVTMSESQVVDAMQKEFENILDSIWEE